MLPLHRCFIKGFSEFFYFLNPLHTIVEICILTDDTPFRYNSHAVAKTAREITKYKPYQEWWRERPYETRQPVIQGAKSGGMQSKDKVFCSAPPVFGGDFFTLSFVNYARDAQIYIKVDYSTWQNICLLPNP